MEDKQAREVLFEQLCGGYDSNYTYLIGCPSTGEMALIDTSVEWKIINSAINTAKKHGYTKLTKIFLTHAHFDHVLTLQEVKANIPDVEIYAHTFAKDKIINQKNITCDYLVEDEDRLTLGEEKLRVIHTPGHQSECICFVWRDKVFTGDTLFVEGCGRCDFPDSNPEHHYQSLARFAFEFPAHWQVCSGHNYGSMPISTLEHERQYNPYLLQLLQYPDQAKERFLKKRQRK